jgi:hypothetical protein
MAELQPSVCTGSGNCLSMMLIIKQRRRQGPHVHCVLIERTRGTFLGSFPALHCKGQQILQHHQEFACSQCAARTGRCNSSQSATNVALERKDLRPDRRDEIELTKQGPMVRISVRQTVRKLREATRPLLVSGRR